MKALIVGAGPIGSYLAAEVAKEHEVRLVEEHNTIGAPVQCTGILTDDILNFMTKKELKSMTKAVVKSTTIFSPNNKVQMKISPNYVIDNIAHAQHYAHLAHDRGANILTNTRYVSNTHNITLKDVKTQTSTEVEADTLIGADGPTSSVAKHNGMYGTRSFLTGVQAVVKLKDYDEGIHFYPSIGEYAWYCPEGEGRARIGVAARSGAKKIFDSFITKYPGTIEFMQGGPIPLYRPRPVVRAQQASLRVDLIGDSVPLIKNTTGGGIIPGTKAASVYAKNPDKYPQNLGSLKKELYLHYLINKAMQKFSDKDWDTLIVQAQDEKVQRILKKTNRDNALGMATQLLLAKPQMMAWARKLL